MKAKEIRHTIHKHASVERSYLAYCDGFHTV